MEKRQLGIADAGRRFERPRGKPTRVVPSAPQSRVRSEQQRPPAVALGLLRRVRVREQSPLGLLRIAEPHLDAAAGDPRDLRMAQSARPSLGPLDVRAGEVRLAEAREHLGGLGEELDAGRMLEPGAGMPLGLAEELDRSRAVPSERRDPGQKPRAVAAHQAVSEHAPDAHGLGEHRRRLLEGSVVRVHLGQERGHAGPFPRPRRDGRQRLAQSLDGPVDLAPRVQHVEAEIDEHRGLPFALAGGSEQGRGLEESLLGLEHRRRIATERGCPPTGVERPRSNDDLVRPGGGQQRGHQLVGLLGASVHGEIERLLGGDLATEPPVGGRRQGRGGPFEQLGPVCPRAHALGGSSNPHEGGRMPGGDVVREERQVGAELRHVQRRQLLPGARGDQPGHALRVAPLDQEGERDRELAARRVDVCRPAGGSVPQERPAGKLLPHGVGQRSPAGPRRNDREPDLRRELQDPLADSGRRYLRVEERKVAQLEEHPALALAQRLEELVDEVLHEAGPSGQGVPRGGGRAREHPGREDDGRRPAEGCCVDRRKLIPAGLTSDDRRDELGALPLLEGEVAGAEPENADRRRLQLRREAPARDEQTVLAGKRAGEVGHERGRRPCCPLALVDKQ